MDICFVGGQRNVSARIGLLIGGVADCAVVAPRGLIGERTR